MKKIVAFLLGLCSIPMMGQVDYPQASLPYGTLIYGSDIQGPYVGTWSYNNTLSVGGGVGVVHFGRLFSQIGGGIVVNLLGVYGDLGFASVPASGEDPSMIGASFTHIGYTIPLNKTFGVIPIIGYSYIYDRQLLHTALSRDVVTSEPIDSYRSGLDYGIVVSTRIRTLLIYTTIAKHSLALSFAYDFYPLIGLLSI